MLCYILFLILHIFVCEETFYVRLFPRNLFSTIFFCSHTLILSLSCFVCFSIQNAILILFCWVLLELDQPGGTKSVKTNSYRHFIICVHTEKYGYWNLLLALCSCKQTVPIIIMKNLIGGYQNFRITNWLFSLWGQFVFSM